MSKHNAIQITIPHPCLQNRDEMTHNADGRFCAHCQKTVIDFSAWSDAALYHFFSKNTGNVCGTFSYDQLSRPIHIPYQPHSRLYRITVAMGLTLIFTQTPNLLAQNLPPKTEQTSILKQVNENESKLGYIGGRVLNEKKEVLPGATVQVYLGTILKGEAITDLDGNYTIRPLEPGYYDLLVKHDRYNEIKVTGVFVSPHNRTTQNFILKRVAANELPTVDIISYRKPLVDGGVSANRLIITPEQKPKCIAPIPIKPLQGLKTGEIAAPRVYGSDNLPLIDMDNPTKKTFTKKELEHMGE